MLLHHSLAAGLAIAGLTWDSVSTMDYFSWAWETSCAARVGRSRKILCRNSRRDFHDGFARQGDLCVDVHRRAVLFIKHSIQLWKDSFEVLGAGTAKFPAVTYGFMVTNLFFNVLQIAWTKLLIDGILDVVRGGGARAIRQGNNRYNL